MGGFQEVDVQQAKKLVDQGNITIVDIRDPDSFEQGHIAHALSVNDRNIEEFISSTDKRKPILCYCYMGFSSQGACQYFKGQGFEKVYSMKGGFTEWQKVYNIPEESSKDD
jgi:thiosulfate sulfurtransferase